MLWARQMIWKCVISTIFPLSHHDPPVGMSQRFLAHYPTKCFKGHVVDGQKKTLFLAFSDTQLRCFKSVSIDELQCWTR
jgi:hypothetical protein